jgi:hypothetical protein
LIGLQPVEWWRAFSCLPKGFMTDEATLGVPSGDSSPAIGTSSSDVAAPPAGQESSADTDASTAGGVTATQGEQDNSGNVNEQVDSAASTQEIDPLEGVPSLEELSQNQSQPYAKALVQLRTAYDALKPQFSELEPLSAFKDIVSKTTPEQLATKLEIVDGFFSKVVENGEVKTDGRGMPLTTAIPGLEKLANESPESFFQIFSDGLTRFEVDGERLDDYYGKLWLQRKGIDPANLEQHVEWEKTGAPVATSGVDTSVIPEQYHAAFKTLPLAKQRDLAFQLASENTELREVAQYDLDQAQGRYEEKQARATEQQQHQQAFQQNIEKSGVEFVDTIFKEEYDSTLQSIASQWQSSSDPNRDALQQHMIMNTLVNLTDPRMSFSAEAWLKSLSIQPDPKIPELAVSVENKAKQVKTAEAYGDQFKANQLRDELRNERLQLKAKVNGIATLMVKALSGQLLTNGEQTDELLRGAESRPSVTGTGAQANGRRQLVNPNDLTDRRNYIGIAQNTGLLNEG